MPSLLLLVKPDEIYDSKAAEVEACEVALSPISVTMEDIDEKLCMMDTSVGLDDVDDIMYESESPVMDFNDMSNSSCHMLSDDECSATASIDCDTPQYSFWSMPPELRTLVYENLLLSDSAFRLGHHGPYSHESRRQLYPQILRACSTIFNEASNVLYGDNTFYLGPIGHKPTYSASFRTSIGAHNASKIRTLVAHSTHPSFLTERYLRNWISSFGLEVSRIRSLGISFSSESTLDEDLMLGGTPTHAAQVTVTSTVQVQQQTQNISLTVHPNAPINASIGLSPTATLTTLILHPSQFQLSPPTTVIGPAPLTLPSSQIATTITSTTTTVDATVPDDKTTEHERVWQRLQERLGGWGFKPANSREVDRWLVRKNTDLRAGEKWMLYVSPLTRFRCGLRY